MIPSKAPDAGAVPWCRHPTWAHVLPFALWLAIMMLPGSGATWNYALRTVATLAALLWLRPWQWYPRLQLRAVPLALGVGVLVTVVWVGPETAWFAGRFPGIADAYRRVAVLGAAEVPPEFPFAAGAAGRAGALIRLAGSALVIAVAEEFFWRGFLYRRLIARDFLAVNPRTLHLGLFLAVAVTFGFEHNRWLVGIVAGIAYGWLYVRTGLWTAAVAHVTTNALLGCYVLSTGAYQFW